jgi:hypothetical protein
VEVVVVVVVGVGESEGGSETSSAFVVVVVVVVVGLVDSGSVLVLTGCSAFTKSGSGWLNPMQISPFAASMICFQSQHVYFMLPLTYTSLFSFPS